MKEYQVFIDVPYDEDWLELYVETLIVEAHNCNDAYDKAIKEAQKYHVDFYVWEVTEEDIIN